ncbi:N-methyl-D-aspartate receptor NMDAR2C subunit [Variovorax sp. Sphag1AA]|uniref:HD domain-containing protein n=1 Tax=Variovorax sp. Sphag1AA TaxID=2587027 RepID=UPI001620012C|nr:N-methyl-D-aspartate receptor NMDAR2C subunit [Variovorax sp. Sphag1AA]MBB3177949.1 putative metal-dependent HD superfamily phosphohydrolase [Variovorax sp. Sphag1AA]
MDEAALHESWINAWRALDVASPSEALLDELLAAHCEAHRAYHTLQHLGECLALLHARRDRPAQRPAEVAIALWFHDAVYDVHRHDNEERSADWARRVMLESGVSEEAADRVHALILATRHDAQPEGGDAQLLVDIDLAILGATPDRFAEYERQIRIEYLHVPADVFETKRREILAGFLARDPLYLTGPMRARFEEAARANLKRAIKR